MNGRSKDYREALRRANIYGALVIMDITYFAWLIIGMAYNSRPVSWFLLLGLAFQGWWTYRESDRAQKAAHEANLCLNEKLR